MTAEHDESEEIRAVALKNAHSIRVARQRAEDDLRKHSEWLRVTLSNIGDAVISAGADGRVTLMNEVAESLTGWKQADVLGCALGDLFFFVDEHTRLPVENPAIRALRESVPVRITHNIALLARDGTVWPIDDNATPIRSEQGEIAGVVLVFRDITERKRAEDERDQLLLSERAARAEAERANRLKEDFLATLSHEVRTPLSAILGWAQILLRKGTEDETIKQGLFVIERNARIQAQLIADLLDMSRIISGKMRLEIQRLELPVVIAAALDSIRPTADAKGIRIESVLEPILDTLHGDPARLQQVVWNLISNAVKFTPRGGRVQVVLSRVNSQVELSVSDTGKGITADFLPHVFERFRQADSSTARDQGGLGLGLAIVKQLVELHAGSIRVTSDGQGRGATFTVSLPVAVMHDDRAKIDRVHPNATTFDSVCWEPAALAGVRVLVVDDETDARELVRRVLEECQAEVILAHSVEEAITMVERESPDVILSDIGLPGRDGYDFMKTIRGRGIRTPAAAVTAFARSEDRTRALHAGYQTHLAKPVEPAELVATVASLAQMMRRETGGPGP